MVWKVEFSKKVLKTLDRIDSEARKRILEFLYKKVKNLSNPRSVGKALIGTDTKIWRYRVGDYRILCEIEDNIVTILVIGVGHRKEVYKK